MPRLFVEQLTVIDCAFLDAQRGLVGESWIVDVELEGALDAQSMVLDFGAVKRLLKAAIDDSLDHTLLVPMRAPALQLRENDGEVEIDFDSALGRVTHRSPALALSRIDTATIDAAAVAAHLRPVLRKAVPESVAHIHLNLRHEAIDGAFHHYVHGLKKHDGHCQRIAHGHRSRIDIRVDGARDAELENELARRWRDIYLATAADLCGEDAARYHFVYTAREGRYALSLPKASCELLAQDTTIECIAAHLAEFLAGRRPGRPLEVRAYEGVMKGAVARSS